MDNIFLTILKLFLQGLFDCLKNLTTVFKLDYHVSKNVDRKTERKEREILSLKPSYRKSMRLWLNRHKVFKCIIWCSSLSILIYSSIYLFYSLLLPMLRQLVHFVFGKFFMSFKDISNFKSPSNIPNIDRLWYRVEKVISIIFNGLWLLPIFIVSKMVCAFWFTEVADNCYYITYGKPIPPQNISIFIADTVFSIIVQLIFLIQCTLVSNFPISGVNYLLQLIHCSLLHSWYAFEYKWINFNWDIKKRLLQLHTFWPYYVGFGLPMHLVMTELVNYLSEYKRGILSGCFFSAAFPLMIVSAISTNRELKLPRFNKITIRLFDPSVVLSDYILLKVQKRKNVNNSGKKLIEKEKTRNLNVDSDKNYSKHRFKKTF